MATKKKEAKLRVRMYRVGMGDCFLVTVPEGSNEKHILVDCGVHSQSQFKALPQCVAELEKHVGGKLDVVVATHAHADHISGFGTESEVFERLDIGEVWLPWFEDLSNPEAKKLHKKAAALTAALEKRAASLAADDEGRAMIEWVTLNASGSFLGAGGRSSTGNNAKALKSLREGFGDAGRVRFLKAGVTLKDAGGIKGLTVRVLAPSDDPKFLSKMHPPEEQLYGLDANGDVTIDTYKPFGERAEDKPAAPLDDAYRKLLIDSAAVPWEALALSVDNYLNNTSLSLLMQYKGKTLLFPGDAQWGNWMSWEDDWPSILNDISFYKVGHHGSHNATPKKALELMTKSGVAAMASTDTVKSFNRGNFPVPYPKLVKKVKAQVMDRYAQSDELGDADKPFKAGPKIEVDGKKLELWCDYEI